MLVKSVRSVKLEYPVPVYDATSPTENYALENGAVVHNTAKNARNREFQAILNLRGKVINAYGPQAAKVLENKECQHILIALGIDLGQPDPLKNMSVRGKIILLTDPDVDGKHISVLILSFLQRVVPALFKMGMVYIVDAPLYVTFYKNRHYFGGTVKEVLSKLPKNAKPGKVTYIKGWGEVNEDILEPVAFDPKTRKLTLITEIKGNKLLQYSRIVGDDTAAKRKLLGINTAQQSI